MPIYTLVQSCFPPPPSPSHSIVYGVSCTGRALQEESMQSFFYWWWWLLYVMDGLVWQSPYENRNKLWKPSFWHRHIATWLWSPLSCNKEVTQRSNFCDEKGGQVLWTAWYNCESAFTSLACLKSCHTGQCTACVNNATKILYDTC